MTAVDIRDIRFAPAKPELRARGLEGWASFQLGAVRVDGVGVRRCRDGRFKLSFPTRIDSNGAEHAYVRPLDRAVHEAIESAVLAEVRKRGPIP